MSRAFHGLAPVPQRPLQFDDQGCSPHYQTLKPRHPRYALHSEARSTGLISVTTDETWHSQARLQDLTLGSVVSHFNDAMALSDPLKGSPFDIAALMASRPRGRGVVCQMTE